MAKKNSNKEISVQDCISSITDQQTVKDTKDLLEVMQEISGSLPKIWNVATFGFDSYHYQYGSGREGDNFIIGFYPRKNKITIYLMDGTARYESLLKSLGEHSITGYCIYIKKLSDISLPVLKKILQQSYVNIKSKSSKGPISEILWKSSEK